MIGPALTRWLVAVLIALLLSCAHLLDDEPLQATADDKADAIAQAQRVARFGDAP